MSEVKLGSVLYKDIESNDYLNEIYAALLFNYSAKLFGLSIQPKPINKIDALRFADILSKSTSKESSERHKILSQELIALINALYPDDETVKYFMGSVLTSVGNLPGVKLRVPNYENQNPLDRIFDTFNLDYFSIPASPNEKFYTAQKDIYNHLGDHYYSYSGPTSMGKSFVVRMFIKQQVFSGQKKNFGILVPTKALINEVSSEIIDDLKDLLNEKNYRVATSANSIAIEQKHNFIYVMTPERMLYLLVGKPDTKIDFLFIDEAQRISVKETRSAFYFKVIEMLRNSGKTSMIFASPNIPNPDVYLRLVGQEENGKTLSKSTSLSPVVQIKYLVDLKSHQYQIFNSLKNNFIENIPINEELDLTALIRSISNSPGENPKQSLVFCCSKEKAIKYALAYAEDLPDLNDQKLNSFSNQIAEEVNADYFLVKLVKKGIAFHIGYLPSTIRMELENLFREGLIRTVFCTSTLIEGVNLPADNLFITNYKNGNSNMTAVEFKNLIGRVGRIRYNLYGNVFLVLDNQTKQNAEEKYKELVTQEPEEQKLSVCLLKQSQKQIIVGQLMNGDTSVSKEAFGSKCTEEEFSLIRKFSIILLDDIVKGTDSTVKKEFEKDGILNPEKESAISRTFSSKAAQMTNDINVSLDQSETLEEAVRSGMEYPKLDQDRHADYNELNAFLHRMSGIFNWNQYERQLVGNNGNSKLNYYSQLLMNWIGGHGLYYITNQDLRYRERNQTKVLLDGQLIPYDGALIMHRNLAISQTLENIDRVILFSFSNYFLKFSAEYKKQHGEDSLEGRDWYEFIEFGSTNYLSIFLQRNGYSRDSAIFLMDHKEKYIKVEKSSFKIFKSIFECGNRGVIEESKEILFNSRDLFIDET